MSTSTISAGDTYLQQRHDELSIQIESLVSQQESTSTSRITKLRAGVVASTLLAVVLISLAGYLLLTFQFMAFIPCAIVGAIAFFVLGPLAEKSIKAQDGSFENSTQLSAARRQLRSIDHLISDRSA